MNTTNVLNIERFAAALAAAIATNAEKKYNNVTIKVTASRKEQEDVR